MILLAVGVWTFNLILVGAAIFSALLAGRVFCGWICPMGAWSDHVLGRLSGVRARRRFPPGVSWVFAAAFIGTFVYLFQTRLLGRWLPFALMGTSFVLATAAGLKWGARTWCAQLCPWGTLAGLASKLAPTQLAINDGCRRCRRCVQVCPVGGALEPRTQALPADARCIRCLLCVEACPWQSVALGSARERTSPGPAAD